MNTDIFIMCLSTMNINTTMCIATCINIIINIVISGIISIVITLS